MSRSAQPDPQVMARLEKMLERFHAEPVNDITEKYTFHPNLLASKLGSGSYGDAFRMKAIGNSAAEPVVVKCIAKARVSRTMLQVQHLAAELAVTQYVRHQHINRSAGLLHSPTQLFIVLELCEGAKGDILSRLLVLLAKYNPARIPEAPAIVEEFEKEAVAALRESGASCESLDENEFLENKLRDFMVRQLGVKKEPPVGSDLFNAIVFNKRIPERKARIILKQVLLGLKHLHSNNIVHRDMKTENVVVAESRTAEPIFDADGRIIGARVTERIEAKIIDFGLAKYMHLTQFSGTPSPSTFGNSTWDSTSDPFDAVANPPASFTSGGGGAVVVTPCGTEVYCALEAIQGILDSGLGRTKWQSTRAELPKIDVYGAGAVMFCMCNGRPPFRMSNTYRPVTRDEKIRQLQSLIQAGPIFSSTCPAEAVDITKLLMRNDPQSRPTAAEALQHPYFTACTNTFVYEVSVTGSITNVDTPVLAPAAATGGAREGADRGEDEVRDSSHAAGEGAGAEDDDECLNDDIMTALRGKEDGGDLDTKKES